MAPQLDWTTLVTSEEIKSIEKHGNYNSSHEAYAVLLEEIDELWDEVRAKKFDRQAAMRELIQIAAVAKKFYEQCESGIWGNYE